METILEEKKPHLKLNELQMSVLRLLNQNISDTQMLNVKNLLVDYFENELKQELSKVISEKKYTIKDYQKMLNGKS